MLLYGSKFLGLKYSNIAAKSHQTLIFGDIKRITNIFLSFRSPYPSSDFECASEHLKWARNDSIHPRYVFIKSSYHKFVENKNVSLYQDFRKVVHVSDSAKTRLACFDSIVDKIQIVLRQRMAQKCYNPISALNFLFVLLISMY